MKEGSHETIQIQTMQEMFIKNLKWSAKNVILSPGTEAMAPAWPDLGVDQGNISTFISVQPHII